MKESYQSAARCAYELCKRADPIAITPGHRRKLYHDAACRQAQHRLLASRRTYEAFRQLWAVFLPETRAVLGHLLEEHGEKWTRRLISAICAERDQARQPQLTADERAAVQTQYATFQPFTRNILDALLSKPHDTLSLLNLILLAVGEEQRHASCNSALEQRAAYLEVALAEYRRIIDLEDREKIRQQFMSMGHLLGYQAVPKYRIDAGPKCWEDYASWTDERSLSEIILFGREVLAEEAAARERAQERSQLKRLEGQLVEAQQRIEQLEHQLAREREAALAAERELERDQQELGTMLFQEGQQLGFPELSLAAYQDIDSDMFPRLAAKKADWEDASVSMGWYGLTVALVCVRHIPVLRQLAEVERLLEEEHARRVEMERQVEVLSSPASKAQTANLDRDLAAVRINVASAELLNTPYGQALLAVVEREREVEHLKRRIEKQYERRIAKLQTRLEALEAERTEWTQWRQAQIAGSGDLTAMRTYLQEHEEASIPIKRNGVVVKVWALGPDGVACTEGHGILRLSDEELQQGRVWVCRKLGLPIIATWLPIGSRRARTSEDE
jgi:hypothetical protein